jgi:hypothetical protein
MEIAENSFDRGKIFYPLVMNFIYSMHGFIELASRGLIHSLSNLKGSNSTECIDNLIEQFNFDDNRKNQFNKITVPTPLIGDLEFKKHDNRSIKIDIDEIAAEIFLKGVYLSDSLINSACILLISAHAKTKGWDDINDPIWNFFYHCRNASAHNNSFKIEKKRFPAKWRKLEITIEMNRSNLFKDKAGVGLLYPGDAITLLWDIEQKYPSMKIKIS